MRGSYASHALNLLFVDLICLTGDGLLCNAGTIGNADVWWLLQALRLGTGIASGLIVIFSGFIIPLMGLAVRPKTLRVRNAILPDHENVEFTVAAAHRIETTLLFALFAKPAVLEEQRQSSTLHAVSVLFARARLSEEPFESMTLPPGRGDKPNASLVSTRALHADPRRSES